MIAAFKVPPENPKREYIDREAAIVAIKKLYPGIPFTKRLLEKWHEDNKPFMLCETAIEKLPAADVRPVVLCRDCKRYGGRPWENNETGICARTDCGVREDDFCSYGEKQEEI